MEHTSDENDKTYNEAMQETGTQLGASMARLIGGFYLELLHMGISEDAAMEITDFWVTATSEIGRAHV